MTAYLDLISRSRGRDVNYSNVRLYRVTLWMGEWGVSVLG